MDITLLAGYIAGVIVVSALAEGRGRFFVGWFVLSGLVSPLIGYLCLIALPNLKQQAIEEQRHKELLEALAGKK